MLQRWRDVDLKYCEDGLQFTGNGAEVAGSCRNCQKLTENVVEVTGS